MKTPNDEAKFEKFKAAVNWAQEQAGFPSFVIVAGYFGPGGFYAANMAMTAESTKKDEITLHPLIAATFVGAVQAQCEQYALKLADTVERGARASGIGETEALKMRADFLEFFSAATAREGANFLKQWYPDPNDP